ncbi:MAG: hypothetical protein ACREBS_02315, partial [Nitrososphaerales archaeon]
FLTDTDKSENTQMPNESILRITDELVRQVDRTKRLVLSMIIAVVVAIPVSWHLSPLLLRTSDDFAFAGYVTILIAAAFLGLGVRQWLVLSKWTKKYKKYKELQERIDRKLDFEGGG